MNYQVRCSLFELKHHKWLGAGLLKKENFLACLATWKVTGN